MRAPLSWLYEYCDAGLSGRELATRLALTGTEVDRVHHHGVPTAENFVVGKVVNAQKHPDADRLSVCEVALGNGSNAQIVCGAPNVRSGQTVAVAKPGAVLPNGMKLGRAKLRGVESAGMILSEVELELGVNSEGIMVLAEDIAPGTPLEEILPIKTEVLELEITPNRPDCLGIYGVAREVHAATGKPLAKPPWEDDSGSSGELAGSKVIVEADDLCLRFTARRFENVSIGPSPGWLKARLMAAGQRPINNVVDITNYVMLLTGQPLHAFDADLIAGDQLTVRRANDGETLTTLDGIERSLDSTMCVISDQQGVTSVAGVIGGERSEVSQETTRVLLESATWDGPNIQRTSTKLGVRTEASGRFEKQLSPEQTMEAQAVATALMIEICGGQVVPGTIDIIPRSLPTLPELQLNEARIHRIVGTDIGLKRAAEILEHLGFKFNESGSESISVTVPHFRQFDVTREIDLIEEITRIWGLENIPTTMPARRIGRGALTPEQVLRRKAENCLANVGFFEAVGWSFTSPDIADRLLLPQDDDRRETIQLANPMSEDQSLMRFTLLGSLLDVAQRNNARGAENIRLFEIGTIFGQKSSLSEQTSLSDESGDSLPTQKQALAVLMSGTTRPTSWGDQAPPEHDFFSAKAIVALLLDSLRVKWTTTEAKQPFLHPGRSAELKIDDQHVGWIGQLHPDVCANWDLGNTFAFEVDFAKIAGSAAKQLTYKSVTSFPPVREDIAMVFADSVKAESVLSLTRAAGGKLLTDIELFDLYRSEQLGVGHHSLALRLTFEAGDRTLNDEEVAQRRKKIITELTEKLGGQLRS